jgi:hypothetical protein
LCNEQMGIILHPIIRTTSSFMSQTKNTTLPFSRIWFLSLSKSHYLVAKLKEGISQIRKLTFTNSSRKQAPILAHSFNSCGYCTYQQDKSNYIFIYIYYTSS